MYSNSLSGDVNSLEIADAGFGSVSTCISCSRAATSAGGISPVNVIREPQFNCSANAFTRARGFSPSFSPAFLVPISTAAAPSTMPEELPAWWTWLSAST